MAIEAGGEHLLDVRVATASRWKKLYLQYERLALGAVTVACFFLIWELIARLGLVKVILTSSPTRIAAATLDVFSTPAIYHHLQVSASEFFSGFGLAAAVGIPLGLLAGRYRRFNFGIDPFLTAFNSVPRIAFLPLIIMWFGIGISSKLAIVFLGAFFPICISTMSGAQNVDAGLLKAARSFSASELETIKSVVLPSSVPFIIAGLRLGIGRGLVGVVVGELYAATAGVGFFIARAGQSFETDRLFVGILIIAVFGVVSTELLLRLEKRFANWRPQPLHQ